MRLLTGLVLLLSACDCGFQPVEECRGPRCAVDAGSPGGGPGNDAGAWSCGDVRPSSPPGPWCTDDPNSTRSCNEAALVAQGSVAALTSDPSYLAWTSPGDGGAGTVWLAPRDGGTPRCVARYSAVPGLTNDVALAAGYVYWASHEQTGRVMRAPLGGGPAEIFSDERDYPTRLVANDTWVWWSPRQPAQLTRRRHTGGSPETVATELSEITALAVDATHVYWATSQAIRRAPATTSAAPFTWLTLNRPVAQLQVNNGFLYWLATGDAAVYRQPTQGGLTAVVASNPATVLNFATDGERIYWFLDGSSFGSGPLLYGAPLAGSGVRLLAPRVAGPLVADTLGVYLGGDALRRMAK